MPILITIATVTTLFKRGSKEQAGFLAPVALRAKLEDLEEGPARLEALEIADQLDALASEYDDATDAAISAYIEDVERWSSTADELIEDLQPVDQLRRQTLSELVPLRQRLIDALSPEEWDQVFG
jgi:uncharacterized membrane protein YccC